MANKFLITAILLILTSALAGGLCISYVIEWTLPWSIIGVFASIPAFLCFILGVMCLVISTQRTSEHNSILSSLHYFIIKYFVLYNGTRMLRRFRECCKNPRKVQENLLLEIIKKNKNTDYGRQFQLGNINSMEDLRKEHPITDYNHYEAFVNKIAKGEKNVLTTEIINRLVLTSGTTGKGKRIPTDIDSLFRSFSLIEVIQHEMFPDLQPMQQTCVIRCNSEVRKSECGISIASLTALEAHQVKNMVVYSTPPEGFLIENFDEATYVHLLFALRDRNLGYITTGFSSLFLESMKYLEANWQKLVNDLARGTLNPDLKLTPYIRSSLTKALGSGDARRATQVQRECEKGFDGILIRLWPHLHFIVTVDNVGIRDRLKMSIAKGLKICSPMYISSEALLGLNMCSFETEGDDYVLNVAENVFEFVPEDEMNKPNARTLFVDEVEVGQNYELLFTQSHGLYRYGLGDVINVSGFYKNCPRIKFLYRKATLLNLIGEKVSQPVIQDSLKTTLKKWGDTVELSHYNVAESFLLREYFRMHDKEGEKSDLYYIFFLELKIKDGKDFPGDLRSETLAQEIDKNILEHHDDYFRPAVEGSISRSKVFFVMPGGFNKLRDFILANSTASRLQFKMPLKLRTVEMAKVLLENTLK